MLPEDVKYRLVSLRRRLHQNPELAGEEIRTAQQVRDYLEQLTDSFCFTEQVGGHGLLASFKFKQPGPAIALRAELDALPITERSNIPHSSLNDGKSHLCGHDGHMSILCGAAELLLSDPPPRGELVLVFQPAEESGEGAKKMLLDNRLSERAIDSIYSIHNIPGKALGQVLIRDGVISLASVGLRFQFQGKTAHACEPEAGHSPLPVITGLLQMREALGRENDRVQITVVAIRLGEQNFGISPGQGELCMTLRSSSDEILQDVIGTLTGFAREEAERCKVAIKTDLIEPFSTTVNTADEVVHVKRASRELDYVITEMEAPFAWSEDFGKFTCRWPGALIGLGAGEQQPHLHDPYYDFPDDLLDFGVCLLEQIVRQECQ